MLYDASENPFLNGDSAIRSLNRARIAALPPNLPIADDIIGKTGYELLSTASLEQLILADAEHLQLDTQTPNVVRRFNACFNNPAALPYAEKIAQRYGQRLGCLLLMLKQADGGNQAARPNWSALQWAFWQQVERVYFGGGLLAGQLGSIAVESARQLLTTAGITNLALEHASYAAHLPLIGLARSLPAGLARSLLFDFGQSSVKRGRASYRAGSVYSMNVWPAAPTVCEESVPPEQSERDARQRWERMAEIITVVWAMLPPDQRAGTGIGISIACYLSNGHPYQSDRGCYGILRQVSGNLTTFIEADLTQRLGQELPITLMHDGAAAATAYAGNERSVVLTLGTAIGNGFPPAEATVLPLADAFMLRG